MGTPTASTWHHSLCSGLLRPRGRWKNDALQQLFEHQSGVQMVTGEMCHNSRIMTQMFTPAKTIAYPCHKSWSKLVQNPCWHVTGEPRSTRALPQTGQP